MSNRLRVSLAAGAFVAAGIGPAIADPRGLWQANDGSRVRIANCGKALCGTMVSAATPSDTATGRPWTDKNNPDAAKRDRPLVGVQVLFDMHPNGPGKWSGTLYDSDRGRTYSGNLIDLGADRIRIEGCMLVLCGGEQLSRVR